MKKLKTAAQKKEALMVSTLLFLSAVVEILVGLAMHASESIRTTVVFCVLSWYSSMITHRSNAYPPQYAKVPAQYAKIPP